MLTNTALRSAAPVAGPYAGRYDVLAGGDSRRTAGRRPASGDVNRPQRRRSRQALGLLAAASLAVSSPAWLPATTAHAQLSADAIAGFGDAGVYGSPAGQTRHGIVAQAATPTGRGYWLVASDGGVFSYGDASYFGSGADLGLTHPVVGMAATPSGRGYWLVASDGGVFSFGDARFHGSTGQLHLNQPIVAIAAAPGGGGYWLVARDGGVFAFGEATFYGSVPGRAAPASVVGIAASPTGRGYWVAAAEGTVLAFGDATDHGGLSPDSGRAPVTAIAATPTGGGYWLAASDGGVFSFGDAAFHGSMGGDPPGGPVAAITSSHSGQGYWLATGETAFRAFDLGDYSATCYDLSGRTASGTPTGENEIAVDPRVIPLGSHLYVEGVGIRTAEDTGGAIVGHRIDVWKPSGSACADFGRQTLRVWQLPG